MIKSKYNKMTKINVARMTNEEVIAYLYQLGVTEYKNTEYGASMTANKQLNMEKRWVLAELDERFGIGAGTVERLMNR